MVRRRTAAGPDAYTGAMAVTAPPPSGNRRTTRQRTVVQEVLDETTEFVSAQQVHHLLRTRGETVGLSTVYRNLQAMADERAVDTLRDEDGEVRYRRCGEASHHHHLICRSCGRVEEIDGPAVETWADRAAREHGFTDVTHTLELFGLCGACSA